MSGATVSRITVARLHNRGNFEHSRYEVSVNLGEGADPGAVLRDLEQLLEDVKPTPPYDMWGLPHYRKKIEDSDRRRAAGVEELASDAYDRKEAERKIAEHEAWVAKREAAFAKLRDIGGTVKDTDVKETWDDEP